jgi:hypothetical protein
MPATPWYEQVHTTKKFRLLTRKLDSSGNEYIYLKGVASLADGDFVRYDGTGVTTRAITSMTADGPIAVAKAAVDASTSYGWFLVRGRDAAANVATHSSGAGKALFVGGTAGRATTTPASEECMVGAFSDGDSVSNSGPVFLVYPVASGDIST